MTKKLLVWLSDVAKETPTLFPKDSPLEKTLLANIPIPKGFLITPYAYKEYFQENNLENKINHLLSLVKDTATQEKVSKNIKKEILSADFSEQFVKHVFKAYTQLGNSLKNAPVVVTVNTPHYVKQQELEGEANLLLFLKELLVDFFVQNVQDGQKLIQSANFIVIVQHALTPDFQGKLITTDPKDKNAISVFVKEKNTVKEYTVKKTGQDIQNIPGLSLATSSSLLTYAKSIEKLFYFPQQLDWAIEGSNIFFTKIIPFTPNLGTKEQPANSPGSIPFYTATRVYASLVDEKTTSQTAQKNFDGVLVNYASLIKEKILHPQSALEKSNNETTNILSKKLAAIGQSFSPRPVIYELSNLTTRDYSNFDEGKRHEIQEDNPLLGFRGAHRHITQQNALSLELNAILKMRHTQNIKNLWLSIPFVRSTTELSEMKKIIASYNLYRSASFKLFLTIQIPSNVILLEEYLGLGIDGVIIDSSLLTTLMTGFDEDSETLFTQHNREDPSLLWAYQHIIQLCQKNNIPSLFLGGRNGISLNLLEILTSLGVSGVIVPPELFAHTKEFVAHLEDTLLSQKT